MEYACARSMNVMSEQLHTTHARHFLFYDHAAGDQALM